MSENALGKATGSNDDEGKEVSCPTCDRMFGSKRGMKCHHATIHDESIAGVSLECEQCGNTYRKPECDADRSRFCSKDCLYKHRTNVTGEDHELYERVIAPCANCGQEQERYPYELEQSENVFCNNQCKYQWISEHIRDEKHHGWVDNTAEFECEQCGDSYTYPKRQSERTRFCSQDCLTNWQSENLSGQNSVHYKGGYGQYYGPNWRRQREERRERDNYECQGCATPQKELDRKLDVHHITPFRKFDSYKRANKLDNLVSLCRSCHQKWEGIPLRPQR